MGAAAAGDEPGRRAMASRTVQALEVTVVWVVAVVSSLAVAAETKVGPVVFSISRRHGIHLGDVVASVVILALAAVTTRALVRSRD